MVPQNNYNSNIKNHWSQINTTNKTMKESEILQELPKCDTEAQSEQLLVEKEPWAAQTDLSNARLPQTFDL